MASLTSGQTLFICFKTPALLFYRQVTDWSFAASYRVNDATSSGRYVPVNQAYIARIYFTQTSDVLAMASKLRFFLEDNPYVKVKYYCGPIEVALRLLYIKVDEDSNVSDKKGPIRYLEFSWNSQLFLDDVDTQKWGLVEKVKIYLNDVGQTILKDNKLIRIIQ